MHSCNLMCVLSGLAALAWGLGWVLFLGYALPACVSGLRVRKLKADLTTSPKSRWQKPAEDIDSGIKF